VPRRVVASRYITPLREGGSLPAIVEADDDGLYVLKFRGAGQGPKALVAEWLAGEVARVIGLPIPEIVFIELPIDLARTEPDSEIQSLIRASAGLNLALDYLPGSVTFDPLTHSLDSRLCSLIVWFDAYVCNVDRTVRNVNMLMWHRQPWLIDHGAALYFQHAWRREDTPARNPFSLIKDHVLLRPADQLMEADEHVKRLLTDDKLHEIIAVLPREWLVEETGFRSLSDQIDAYWRFFVERLKHSDVFVGEAIRARSANL
jgi:hypothetical protein